MSAWLWFKCLLCGKVLVGGTEWAHLQDYHEDDVLGQWIVVGVDEDGDSA